MTLTLARFRSSADRLLASRVSLAALGLLALWLRLYRLERSPFWFDELTTYQISLQSPSVIIRQAWHDPWPPLYYLTVKLTSAFGMVHVEFRDDVELQTATAD